MLIKSKDEKGSRSLRDIASAPVIRKNISKETEKYEYLDVEEFEDPIKILVPNLLANKQKRLQINRGKKRAVTAGFSRSPLDRIGIESEYIATSDCAQTIRPELASFDGFDTSISKRINSFSSHTTTQSKSRHNDSKEGRRKFSVLAADQSFLTVNSSFSDASFRSRSPSIKYQRKKSSITSTRIGFTKLSLNIDSSYFAIPDAAIEDRLGKLLIMALI